MYLEIGASMFLFLSEILIGEQRRMSYQALFTLSCKERYGLGGKEHPTECVYFVR